MVLIVLKVIAHCSNLQKGFSNRASICQTMSRRRIPQALHLNKALWPNHISYTSCCASHAAVLYGSWQWKEIHFTTAHWLCTQAKNHFCQVKSQVPKTQENCLFLGINAPASHSQLISQQDLLSF